ncbi:hypothetical protein [Streptomyces sp. NPDC026673]|uniref:hypothetical protein n=1 Tax=Streptomyces sp. NPDC026673 TaxID=3155724 RepID=UPI0033C254F8
MDEATPGWVRARFGDDAESIQAAVWNALADTEEAVLDVHGVARSKKRFAAGSARMTNQLNDWSSTSWHWASRAPRW